MILLTVVAKAVTAGQLFCRVLCLSTLLLMQFLLGMLLDSSAQTYKDIVGIIVAAMMSLCV